MKSFMKKIDLFCYKHPRFGINNLMLYIVLGNVALWLLSAMDTSGLLLSSLSYSTGAVLHGQIWRLVTFVLVPDGGGLLFLLMLYFYYFIGNALESEWGPGRFTIYYLLGMAMTVVYGAITYFVTGQDTGLTASYLNLSMFFAFATLYPDNIVLFMFILPIKIKWLAIIDALYFVYAIFQDLGAGAGMMAFLPLIGVLNYFLFCGGQLFYKVIPTGRTQRKKTVQFRREARKIRYEQKNGDYTRKCAVCGRTDKDYPNLEFRYCSQCAGYHCFCQDHINNHVHFTE
jgi:hypothetical protein